MSLPVVRLDEGIKINGVTLDCVRGVEIDSDIDRPTMFTVSFYGVLDELDNAVSKTAQAYKPHRKYKSK